MKTRLTYLLCLLASLALGPFAHAQVVATWTGGDGDFYTGSNSLTPQGGTIDGQFRQTDFTEAPLAAGLSWEVQYAPDSVKLHVAGQAAGPRTVTVTTAQNVNPPAGTVSLLQALNDLRDGDTILFNIPGAGPHVIETPPGGYPLITKNNVTIDGYSQPGATPNTNPILAANNAQIKIVLDSRNGNHTLMDFAPTNPNDQTGYGDTEAAVLGILEAQNVVIRGLSILAVPVLPGASPNGEDVALYGISFAKGASGRVGGCWIGVAPDGTTLAGPADGVTGFRYRVRDQNNTVIQDILINDVVIGVPAGVSNPRSWFNVIAGIPAIPIIIEGNGTRISGNFLNVLPSGLQDFNPPLADPVNFFGTFEGNIEIGRGGNNTLIGTDGDGINDADERNVFSGVLPPDQGGYDHNIEFYGQSPGTGIVIAGNYFGLAVDGVTRWPNAVPVLNAAGGSARYRFGSDFDGVSDELEANVCYNNFPQDQLFPSGGEGFFDELSTGGSVSARGNVLVNNYPFPVSPLRDGGAFWQNYYAKALVDVTAGVQPTLSDQTTLTRLIGTVPRANTAEYPTTIIDLYAADPEGIAFGQSVGIPELPNGYVQGKAYIASFVEGSAADLDPDPGEFEFDLRGVEVRGRLLTITANYVKGTAGTHNAETLTSPFSEPVEVTFTPGSLESVGLTRILADTVLSDPKVLEQGLDTLANWEPYASVLGTSHFLIEGNTFALGPDGNPDGVNQRFIVGLQPVDGRAGRLGEGFFADDGTPYRGQINLSRQNGNPGRVAGDKRPGAVNFIVGAEASPHGFAEFQSDSRWSLGFDRGADGRYGTVQTFALNPATLEQTPLSKAFDAVNGRLTSGSPAVAPEIGRFGGDVAALDNGNFVVVVDDRSNAHASDRAATAVIVSPTGAIVRDTFVIDLGQIWSNVAAYKGGFCVRINGNLRFYDNGGNFLGAVDQVTSGVSFDRGRGDGTRIAAHINSPYVFLAGKATTDTTVRLAVWDARDRSFVAKADVSEGAFPGTPDRVNLAVDALNRVTVAWESQPAEYEAVQVAARVLKFDAAAKTITPLTPSFFPFVNFAKTGGIRTFRMSVAMTTKQILVAAKGEINLQNQPAQGANSPGNEINFYTIFTHPDPQDDPTPPVVPGELPPGKPENNGLAAKTDTFYINTPNTINNNQTESLGVAIASNGNVIIGWEDDGDALTDLEAVWTLFDNAGNSITPLTTITSIDPNFAGQTLQSKFLAYFRSDGSAVSGRTAWGPKIKANLWGDGLGMGATAFDLGIEVPELADIQFNAIGDNAGDFPAVQQLNNSGQPVRILSGVDAAYAERDGDIRIADWDFLSNGNIVVVGESRQQDDLVDVYGGAASGRHGIYRVLNSTGAQVKAVSLVSEVPNANEIWHGVGVTANGFAVRFALGGRATVRLFDNAGNPTSGNIDLATLAGNEAVAGGGRGDSVGFHGNGTDAYVAVNASGNRVFVTVLNADGSLRYSRSVIDDLPLRNIGRLDAAISPTGEVIVVFGATYEGGPVDQNGADVSVVLGRLLAADGSPLGGTFYVSENEVPSKHPLRARNPRVAWRDNLVVIVWESLNSGQVVGLDGLPVNTVAARYFTLGGPAQPLVITSVADVGNGVTLTWEGGSAPYLVQTRPNVASGDWVDLLTTSAQSATVPKLGATAFFRVVSGAQATVQTFTASLSGAAEIGDTSPSSATGTAVFALKGNSLWFYLTYSGLSGNATAMHIHGPAASTASAGVMLPLPTPPNGTAIAMSATVDVSGLTADQLNALRSGRTYINVHTGAKPAGEIRGQIGPLNLSATLSGANEVPPVSTTGSGAAQLSLLGNQLLFDIRYANLAGDATAAHIHGPADTSTSAGVLVPLPTPSGRSGQLTGSLSLSPQHLGYVIDGMTYINIHSTTAGGGEIRGQILP